MNFINAVKKITPAIVQGVRGQMVTSLTLGSLGDKPVHGDSTGGAVKAAGCKSVIAMVPSDRPPFVGPEFYGRYLVDDGKVVASDRDDAAVVLCRLFEFYLEQFLLTKVKKCVTH